MTQPTAQSPAARAASVTIAYLATTLFISTAWFLLMEGFVRKLASLSPELRQGYYNPYVDLLALTAGSLFISFVLYGIITTLLSKSRFSLPLRAVIGMITGVIPLIILELSTFGLDFSPGGTLWFSMMLIGGALLPITQSLVLSYLSERKFK